VTASVAEPLQFDSNGLIPAIAQDAENGQVLMHAYMNREALARTLETGLAHYYSRSRQRLWQKGEQSGHIQRVRAILYDCDADTLLLQVEQAVAACHTGNRTCFYRMLPGFQPVEGVNRKGRTAETIGLDFLVDLYGVILERKLSRPEGSYVASLFDKGANQILKKIAEEAAEVALASKDGDRRQVIYEVADLWFHTLVLLAQEGIRPQEIVQELSRRIGRRKADYA
jgi:phosphoribosyl-ATP pyrophosphohydrolase/phosphoribosyl-AMP cyclohydrolase